MKEIYKKRDESHPPRRRERRTVTKKGGVYGYRARRRRILGVALVALLLLGVVIALADYLLNDGELLRGNSAGEVAPTEESGQSAVSEGETEEGAATGNGVTGESNPTVLLGEYFTDYAWDPDEGRQANLRMASGAINETLLKPGEEFSALEVLSPLEYQPAKVFANGGVDYEVGGGYARSPRPCSWLPTTRVSRSWSATRTTPNCPTSAPVSTRRCGSGAKTTGGELWT